MLLIILILCLFNLYTFQNISNETSYEIELPNDDNDPYNIKVVKLYKNELNNYTLNIVYKFENSLENSFSLESKEIFDIIQCIIDLKCDRIERGLLYGQNLYLKYYENGVFQICLFKHNTITINETTKNYLRSLCLDKTEYKRFINVISHLLNVLEK